MEQNPKWINYSVLIQSKLAELFDEEDGEMSVKQLMDDDNFKHFLHALSTVVPANIFNKFTKDDKNHLEYNHIANHLVFEFTNKAPD